MILLLAQLIKDEKKIEILSAEAMQYRKQLTLQTQVVQSLQNKANATKNEWEARVKALENENSDLLKQIDRLKAIDLNPT